MQNSSILIKQLITNDNNLKVFAFQTSSHSISNQFLPQFQSISNDLFEELVDEVLLGIYFEVHRAAKSGSLFVDESPTDELVFYSI